MHWMLILLIPLVLALHIYVIYGVIHFEFQIALEDAIINTSILCLSLWSIILVIRAYPTTAGIFLYALFIALLISGIAIFAEYEILNKWFQLGTANYKQWFNQSLPIRFFFILLFNCWMSTAGAMRKMINISENRFQQYSDASELLKEAELFKLRQQLQPHFLYNSLNSINALIITSPEKAQEMVGKLSDFLRSSIKKESEDISLVKDELIYLQSYLEIESIRFGDRLTVSFENQYPENAIIPPYLLQPIIENAIKFGLYGKTGEVNISVTINFDCQLLKITIINPYDKDTQPPRGTGFGLESIKRRLWLLYARGDLLETEKNEFYFTTILKIPQ